MGLAENSGRKEKHTGKQRLIIGTSLQDIEVISSDFKVESGDSGWFPVKCCAS